MSNPSDSLRAYRGGEPYAFISYARADAHLVFPILQALQDRGFRIWFDEGIKPMDEWMDRLASAIDGAEIFVLFASKGSVSRSNVIREIGRAAENEKPFCTVGLESMQLPRAVAFAVGKDQHVAASERNRAEVVADLVNAFDGYNIREDGVGEPVSDVRTSNRRPVPERPRRRGQRMQVQDSFADRVPESEALLRSVDRQLRRLRDEEAIEPEVFPNVLVFYGGSGLGKTGLSKRLELWVSHGLAESIEWGEWPHEDVVSVRWDFHEAEGNLNLLAMLRALRAALTRSKVDWRAFDIGLAAYLEACRFGEQNALGLSGDVEDEVLRSFQIVASELRMAPPSDLAPSDVRRIVREVRQARGHGGSLDDYSALFTLLDAVQDLSRGGHASEVASDLMYLLTEVIGVLPPEERPLLLFFVDPFERIQRGSETGHEEALAQFVADLPFALFVITGRDKLKWAEENRTGLPFAGPSFWPGLTSGDPMPPEPRQHLLGRLSDEDTSVACR
ncbi:toll/interleukin-1 receptor domain-containing protein [Gordonia phosphorivorans]|uniref:Toll/interleukin-1 receptor domain-containing protein n=1 Tax=Gordonia phosphorivorans TaxID=1056982 RepID=A0ABV6H3J4_9ACTN